MVSVEGTLLRRYQRKKNYFRRPYPWKTASLAEGVPVEDGTFCTFQPPSLSLHHQPDHEPDDNYQNCNGLKRI
jgi:hypothetical protein